MNSHDFCARAQDLVLGELEGDTAGELDRAFLDKHLADCASCQSYRETMRNLTASLQDLEETPVPAGLSDRIMSQVAQESKGSAKVFPWKKSAPIAAAILLVALAVPMALNMSGPQPQTNGPIASEPVQPPMPVQQPTPNYIQPAQPVQNEKGTLAMGQHPQAGTQPHASYQPASPGNHPMTGRQAHPVRQTANPGIQNAAEPVQAPLARPLDSEMIASASPESVMGLDAVSTGAAEQEEDLYYDPVSDLVGF